MSLPHLLSAPVSITVAAGYELGHGRLVPTVALVVGLAGVVLGVLAVRSARRDGAVGALVAGLVGVVVGGLHGVNAAGGLGTGNGLAGAVMAVVLGLVGLVLGGIGLARSRLTRER
ncbi:DUF6223 family protein [Actinophytocola xanthii]|uniref:Uncharacterized protein n=1 Tax=Actinophytocola xanthii TaxID=1912961 RepID=A0A1Q8C919_9PSEU|nr:DUF6223 family protein [Actinophytocola xanthii]OLF10847.1 hypothetical protein BU204_31060 [Actinophytocola xanthii]